ncbi:BrnT family toxin [Oscillatoria amoena NRMC-F 0135]|nr:BrnT family toxin [Oscillatoria amoena NRMC-F 0135]MDL5054534.1 BrnT family toxin [Oscillatoria laete-virens NRMC-F 0139]
MEFEYDSAKSHGNFAKHGIDFEQAKALWNDPRRVEFMARFSDETRFGLVAKWNKQLWTAIFTQRNERTRIISVRRARENEETLYDDSTGV